MIDNDGLHGSRERSGIAPLAAGSHDIEVQFFERSGRQVLALDVLPPGGERQTFAPGTVVDTSLANTDDTNSPDADTDADPASGGQTTTDQTTPNQNNTDPTDTNGQATGPVFFEYFEGSFNTLSDFDALTPVGTGFINTVSLAPAIAEDNFAIRFSFDIRVFGNGVFTFHSGSNDGSQVFVDGQLVVDNDGLHAFREVSGTTTLTSGTHQVVVTFFERIGTQDLNVALTNPNGQRVNLNNLIFDSSSQLPAAGAAVEDVIQQLPLDDGGF